MSTLPPRAVIVTRRTEYQELIAAHATESQARFFLETRGQRIDELASRHRAQAATIAAANAAVPEGWRQARIERGDLDRFLFAPEDVIIVIGQDGLVANAAKYLSGQPVLGINPMPGVIEGILVSLSVSDLNDLLPAAAAGAVELERRVMAQARLDDGQTMTALNEIFVGHRSHQSACYVIAAGAREETQSSSGVVVATGTGGTGWARSLMAAVSIDLGLIPQAPVLGYFVREPWPSRTTMAGIRHGLIGPGEAITIRSQMNEDGVIFADGMEADRIAFGWGRMVEITKSARTLNLVTA